MNTSNNVPVIGASNAVAQQNNMMGGLSVAGATNGASMALANAKAAEAIGMIMAAKAAPRDERVCLQKIEMACGRASLAGISQYELARGGTPISGPSVHLLRAIAGYWGNLKSGSVITSTTPTRTQGYSYAWDMESNRVVEVPFDVPHIRYTRSGSYPLTNPDDIRYLVNSYASRSERKAIEAVVPEDVVMSALDWCNETLKADMKKFDVQNMLDAFKAYGVTKADIEAFIQRDIEALKDSPGNVVRLRKILNSLKDGIAKKEDFFKGVADKPAQEGRDKPVESVGENAKPEKVTKTKKGKTVEEFLAEHPPVESPDASQGVADVQDGELDGVDVL